MLFGVVEVDVQVIFEFVLIFFLALGGSFIYDTANIMYSKSNKLNIRQILASTIFASALVFGMGAYIHMGFRELIIPSIITGFLGFQIIIKISTLEGFFSLARSCIDLAKEVIGLIDRKIPENHKEEKSEKEIIIIERKKEDK